MIMLTKFGLPLLAATLAVCDPTGHHWQHPLSTDRRSLCPGVNALANHGYLPRNGLNISLERFVHGLREGLNFDRAFTEFSVAVYQNFTSTGYNNTLNLNDLDHHAIPGGLGEHDGSLSRNDVYFGNNHSFNKKIFDIVAAHFHDDTISISTAARARKDRFAAAKAVNPHFMLSIDASIGETALYLRSMQGQSKGTKTEYVNILFREERIPFNEGYKRSNTPITMEVLGEIFKKLVAAS